MSTSVPPKMPSRMRKLVQMARDLRDGKSFAITRLLTLRSFCADPEVATQFAVFLARDARSEMDEATRPDRIPVEQWDAYQRLVAEAIAAMDAYLVERTEAGKHQLHELRRALEQLQNEHVSIPFGAARVIENRQALIVETAVRIAADPDHAADLGYQIARSYAERYDPMYGTGLIPASAGAVETILDFWSGFYFGVGLEAWYRR